MIVCFVLIIAFYELNHFTFSSHSYQVQFTLNHLHLKIESNENFTFSIYSIVVGKVLTNSASILVLVQFSFHFQKFVLQASQFDEEQINSQMHRWAGSVGLPGVRGLVGLGPSVKIYFVLWPRTHCQNRFLFPGPPVKININ